MNDFAIHPLPESTRLASVSARLVKLADGRSWGLAVPTPRYRPEVVPGVDLLGRPTTTVRLVARTGYPAPIEQQIADLRTACQAGPGTASDHQRFDALMALTLALLRRAHDLTLRSAVDLLDLDGADLSQLVDAVLEIVTGHPPGPAAGSAPSSPGDGNVQR